MAKRLPASIEEPFYDPHTPIATYTPTQPPTATNTIPPTPEPVAFAKMDFTYDGNGARVKSVLNTDVVTTYFVGAHYEVEVTGTGTKVTKYYYAGTQRIAMRTCTDETCLTPMYLLGDHLGSTSLTVDASGNVLSELRYKAWGEVRYASGTMPTKYSYTGQYSYISDFGLMYYNARWYDSSLGRFNQADTIVPNLGKGVNIYLIASYNEIGFLNQLNQRNSEVLAQSIEEKELLREQSNIDTQGFDRFSYTNNNPVKFTDSTGHCLWDLCIIEGVVSIGVVELVAAGGALAFTAYIYGPGGEQRIESLTNSIVSTGKEVVESLSSTFAKGEYVPPGLSDPERWAYREAVHRYKKIWGLDAANDVPKEILNEIAKLIKRGVKPGDAAEDVDEPPEEDGIDE